MSDLRVRVPATSANLGPGFDSFAIALPLLAEFDVRPGRGFEVQFEGDGGDGIPTGRRNLVAIAARATAKAAKEPLAGLHVTQRSAIPIARGLGSSAAAIVAGCAAANAVLGHPLSRRALLRIAAEVEGHADNVAGALLGGFTIAAPQKDGPVAIRLAFPRAWRAVVFVPERELQTSESRAVLPKRVTRADAIFNLAHASLVVASVMQADGALLGIAMSDRLHEPLRLRLVPALDFVARSARSAGAFAAALSGAGPSVLAIAPTRLASRVAGAMTAVGEEEGWPGRAHVLRVRTAGVQVRTHDGGG
jgi:homoserine kinase